MAEEDADETSQDKKRRKRALLLLSSASPVVKGSVIVGIFLLRIVSSVPWIWGNLAAYVNSFYYAKGDNSSAGLTSWIMSVEIIAFNFGITIGNPIARKIGQRTTLFLGLVLFNAGVLLTYFSVQHSVISLCITFAGMPGFAGGIVEAVQLVLIVRWTERYYGLATTSVLSALVLGGVVLNFLLTWYINPSNEKANAIVDNKAVFAQTDVVERVPSVFLLYGLLSTVLNFLGFFLVRENPGEGNFLTETIRKLLKLNQSPGETVYLILSEEKVVVSRSSSNTTTTNTSLPAPSSFQQQYYESHFNHDSDDSDVMSSRHHDSNIVNEDASSTPSVSDSDVNLTTTRDSGGDDESVKGRSSATPRQVLQQRSFYALLFFKTVLVYSFFILNTYYKTFGLLFIHDDHFLTAIVMVQCLVIPVCTWIGGFAVDKFGVKPTLTSTSGMFCVLTSFFYLTPVNRWLYLFSCLFYGCSLVTLLCITGACCVKLYGETHFTTIYGMTFIACYVIVPCLPSLTEWLISECGWFTLFISVAVLAFFNVFGLLWGLPREKKKRKSSR